MFSRTLALTGALLLVCFAGTASADRLIDYSHNHVDGATVAAKLYQQSAAGGGLYVEVRMRNTRRFPGCINGAVAWRRAGPDPVDFRTSTRPIRACVKKTWINVGRTPVRSVRDISGVSTHVAVEGGKGKWLGMIGWTRKGIKDQADRIVNLSYRSFDRFKRQAERNRARGGARADATWPLAWADDGCSIPGQKLVLLAKRWSRFFDRQCQQHDFGYRNYGMRYLALNRTEGTRLRIDKKLLREAKRACRNSFGGGLRENVKRGQCLAAANIIYKGVRSGGWKPFFGAK